MRVVIIGASGGCGRALVQAAAARGHEVVAVARASSALEAPPSVDVRRGDVTDVAFLTAAFAGADVVCSALGLRLPGLAPWAKPEDGTILARSTPAILAAARAAGVRRVIAISAGGVGDSYAMMPGFFKLLINYSALRVAYAALAEMEAIYLGSGLDVCVCRPTGLTDEPATGRAVVARALSGRAMIPRADVAAWMLDAAARDVIEQRTPVITVTGA